MQLYEMCAINEGKHNIVMVIRGKVHSTIPNKLVDGMQKTKNFN